MRRSRPHRLSEPEARRLAETTLSGPGSWRRLLDAPAATLSVPVDDGEAVTHTNALTRHACEDPAMCSELIDRNLDEARGVAAAMAA